MTPIRRLAPTSVLALGALLLALAPALTQQDDTFMPKGGKTLLLETLGSSPSTSDLVEITNARRNQAEWRAAMATRSKLLSAREQDELATYLELTMPLPAGAVEKATAQGNPALALPADGRELAWTQCQFCHSLFSGYLMQERDVQGWRSVFLSPFHRGLKMTAQEREIFARYSAINMPMKKESVPTELQF